MDALVTGGQICLGRRAALGRRGQFEDELIVARAPAPLVGLAHSASQLGLESVADVVIDQEHLAVDGGLLANDHPVLSAARAQNHTHPLIGLESSQGLRRPFADHPTVAQYVGDTLRGALSVAIVLTFPHSRGGRLAFEDHGQNSLHCVFSSEKLLNVPVD